MCKCSDDCENDGVDDEDDEFVIGYESDNDVSDSEE